MKSIKLDTTINLVSEFYVTNIKDENDIAGVLKIYYNKSIPIYLCGIPS